jgi:hypothetical protein
MPQWHLSLTFIISWYGSVVSIMEKMLVRHLLYFHPSPQSQGHSTALSLTLTTLAKKISISRVVTVTTESNLEVQVFGNLNDQNAKYVTKQSINISFKDVKIDHTKAT